MISTAIGQNLEYVDRLLRLALQADNVGPALLSEDGYQLFYGPQVRTLKSHRTRPRACRVQRRHRLGWV